jgi:hypothetical protein
MGFNLLLVHVTGAQGPNQNAGAFSPQVENDEKIAALRCDAHGAEPLFHDRMIDVWPDEWRASKQAFDLGK